VLSLGVVADIFARDRFDEAAILSAAFSEHRKALARRPPAEARP
jgi:hypothetical protein